MNSTRTTYLVVSLLAITLSLGCGGSLQDNDERVEYSVSAGQNYDKGMKKMENDDWLEAMKFFAFVKARFPYSKYAVLAELRMADAAFGTGVYLQAIDSYKMFVKFHPTHQMTLNGYASFRIGESYMRMLPSDWFLVPPSFEREMSTTHDALRSLSLFQRQYPKSPFRNRGKKMLLKVAKRLASHEWYVAEFYWKRKKPMGTVLRLRGLLKKYPGAGYDEESLFLLGKAYAKVGRAKKARETWESLIAKHPQHVRARQAKTEMGTLGQLKVDPKARGPRPADETPEKQTRR